MATTTTAEAGLNLRRAREEAGLTRAQLAQLAGCSLAQLGNIESGAVPRRSEVLERARRVISERDSDRASQGLAKTSGPGARNEGYR
jgi:transcriptional regulator with XRE-family HTH domain